MLVLARKLKNAVIAFQSTKAVPVEGQKAVDSQITSDQAVLALELIIQEKQNLLLQASRLA